MRTPRLPLLITIAAAAAGRARAQPCEQEWSPVGGGTSGGVTYPAVLSLAVFDEDGSGSAPPFLFAGGNFTHAGGIEVNHLARWDGEAWSSLGSGVGQGQVQASVYSLTVWDEDGPGPGAAALYLGGDFQVAGGRAASHVARWDGESYAPLGAGVNWGEFAANVRALVVHDDDGPGPLSPALYAGGYFTHAGDLQVDFIAQWDGENWFAVGGGMDEPVHGLAAFDEDGSGPKPPALFATGNFTNAGGNDAAFIARWDGSSWSALSTGLNGSGKALLAHDDGSGAALYVGGYFTTAGGLSATLIARWNGSGWSGVGGGLWSDLPFPGVEALTTFEEDAGTGPLLFAGGQFHLAEGRPANNIARWDGDSWSNLGQGLGPGDTLASAYSLAQYDDGAGPDMYAGGLFTQAGDSIAFYIASWNGCSSCLADFNGDGVVDTRDVLSFLNAWAAGEPRADFNQDGSIDTLDVLAFLNVWVGGC